MRAEGRGTGRRSTEHVNEKQNRMVKDKENSNGKLIYAGSSLIGLACFVTAASGKNQLECILVSGATSISLFPSSHIRVPSTVQFTKTIKHASARDTIRIIKAVT